MITCKHAGCPAEARWHNTLCTTHARQVPEPIQKRMYRMAAQLVKAKRPLIVQAYSRRYRHALREAVESLQ